MKFARRKILNDTVEINITAFMNLMVILVPFLLITAVFSRLTVLELNLPALDAQAGMEPDVELQLQLIARPDRIEIRDATLGLIKAFELNQQVIDWQPIVDVLVEVKRRFPEQTAISLLLDRSVNYKTLIDIMDHVRATEIVNVGTLEEVELFPDMAIGDAPVKAEETGSTEITGTSK